MTLPASGAISMNDLNVEMGFSGTAAITLNDANTVRSMLGKGAGTAIALSDAYGLTCITLTTGTYIGSNIGFLSPFSVGSVSPTTLAGYTIYEMYNYASGFQVVLTGQNIPQNTFTTFNINGKSFSSASASYNGSFFDNGAFRTQWVWFVQTGIVDSTVYKTGYK
jgi:hypothetical protein